jgi:hypothetical protein
MAGPACGVLLDRVDEIVLITIDEILARTAETIQRTRKGRVWDVWIRGRPIHVAVCESDATVSLSAGCHGAEDYEVLRQLASAIAEQLDGVADEPVK